MANDNAKDSRERDLKLFKDHGFDEADLELFYATSSYLRKKSKKEPLYVSSKDFISYCKRLKEKKFHTNFYGNLYYFGCFYLTGSIPWWNDNVEKASEYWYDEYDPKKSNEENLGEDADQELKDGNRTPPPSTPKKTVLLLALEKNKLPPATLEKLKGNSFKIAKDNLDGFYRLPWLWHYGESGEEEKLKGLEGGDNDEEAVVIGTTLPAEEPLDMEPGMMGSAMRKEFAKLQGRTFRLLRETSFAALRDAGLNFYRLP